MKVFVIMAHPLTSEQIKELQTLYQPEEIIPLPEDLKTLWMNIPPHGPWNEEWIEGILTWLKSLMKPGDIVIVQGEYGATHFLVNWLKQYGISSYYATTERQVIETQLEDGSIEVRRIFRHVNFREYP